MPTLNYARPRKRRDGDIRWGTVSISLSIAAPFTLVLGGQLGICAATIAWAVGFAVGFLGLWEKRFAKKLAIVGVLLNLAVPVATAIGALLWWAMAMSSIK